MSPDSLLLDETHSESLTIWGITIAVLFFIMVVGMYRSIKFSRASRKEITDRILGLHLGEMLDHLNISMTHYYRHTSDLDKERHTWVCEHCPNPEECNSMLSGEDIDPDTFCPNNPELKELKSGHNFHSRIDGIHSH